MAFGHKNAFPAPHQVDSNGSTVSYSEPGLSKHEYITIEMAKALIGRKDSMIFSKAELASEAAAMANALLAVLP